MAGFFDGKGGGKMVEVDNGDTDSNPVKSPLELAVEKALKLSSAVTKALELEGQLEALSGSKGLPSSRVSMPEGTPHLAVDLTRAISNALANPTEEQRKNWLELSEEQIRDQIAGQVRIFAEGRGIAIE